MRELNAPAGPRACAAGPTCYLDAVIPLGFSAFLLFGFVLVLAGANQDGLSADLGLDLERFGLLGASLSLGIGLGVLAAGPIVDRWPRRPLLVASLVLCALSLLTAERDMGFGRALAHLFVMGFGGGLYDTLLNAVAVERYREEAARWISLLHSGATLGAVASPLWIGALGDWLLSFQVGGGAFVALAAVAAVVPLPPPQRHAPSAPADVRSPASGPVFNPTIAALCAVGFAYVGIEAGLTLFAVPYGEEVLGLGADRGRRGISAFWLGLLVGRLALAALPRPPGAAWLTGMGVGGTLLLAAGPLLALPSLELWLAVVGLALGGVFPLMVTLAGQRVPHAPGMATGLVAGLGSLGGFAIPWLVGALAEYRGTAAAVASLAAASAAVAIAAWLARMPRPGR